MPGFLLEQITSCGSAIPCANSLSNHLTPTNTTPVGAQGRPSDPCGSNPLWERNPLREYPQQPPNPNKNHSCGRNPCGSAGAAIQSFARIPPATTHLPHELPLLNRQTNHPTPTTHPPKKRFKRHQNNSKRQLNYFRDKLSTPPPHQTPTTPCLLPRHITSCTEALIGHPWPMQKAGGGWGRTLGG